MVTGPSLQAKLRPDENGHALKATSDTISCFVGMFLHIFKNVNYFLFHYHSVSFRKLITKMKIGVVVDLIFLGFINESNHQNMFQKSVVNKCRKNSCEGVPF